MMATEAPVDTVSPGADRRLLVAIHDVTPLFADPVRHLLDRIAPALGGPRLAMLVVPNHWGMAPLGAAAEFRAQLRRWAEAGVEMFLHGWLHRDDTAHHGRLDRWRARHMTASEGEFLGLDRAEALRRMRDGRDLVEQAVGAPVTGFVAPAWLYGQGAREAMAELDFPLAEDHLRVWRPGSGAVVARGPVLTWASRTPMRTASSLACAALGRTGLHAMRTVRVAVHPGDVTKSSLLKSIDSTVAAFARRRAVGRYADLLAAAGGAGA